MTTQPQMLHVVVEGLSFSVEVGTGMSPLELAACFAHSLKADCLSPSDIVAADILHSRCGCNAHLVPTFRKKEHALVECSACGACWEWGRP